MTNANAMQFEKRNFMGIELDVLVGHPEHDLLFVATQVARASGLKYPSQSVSQVRSLSGSGVQLEEIHKKYSFSAKPSGVRKDVVLFSEAELYVMLLRGNAPQSEPFRKWVTEEVLPAIRKTGKYNAEDSTNPIAQGIMDRLMSLEGVVLKQNAMLERMQEALGKFAHAENAFVPAEPSPYEGQQMVALCDPAGFNARTYRELAEETIPRPAVDKLEPRVVDLTACL